MSSPEDPAPLGGRGVVIRAAVLVAILFGGFALIKWSPLGDYVEFDRLVAGLRRWGQYRYAPLVLIAFWGIASPLGVPVSPMVFAGGAVFGTLWGWLYSLCGSLLAATISFWIGRLLGHDFLARWLGDARLRRIEARVSRYGFSTLIQLRFVPLPFMLVNTAAALAGVRFGSFILAAVLGLAPALWIYTYFATSIVEATAADRGGVILNLVLALLAFLALGLLPLWLARRRTRRLGDD